MKTIAFCFACLSALLCSNATVAQFNPKKIVQKKVEQKSTDLLNKKTGQAFDSVFNNNNNNGNNSGQANNSNNNNNSNKKDTSTNPLDNAAFASYSQYDFV